MVSPENSTKYLEKKENQLKISTRLGGGWRGQRGEGETLKVHFGRPVLFRQQCQKNKLCIGQYAHDFTHKIS